MAFVLRHYNYFVLALLVGLLVLGVAILLPSFSLLATVFADSTVPLADKLHLLWSLLGSLATNFTTLSAFTTVMISLLVGVNVSLIAYLHKRQKEKLSVGGVAVSSVGTFLGMFGVGCAACGSLVLTALLSSVGGVGLLTILPFQGQEIGILGVLALSFATYFLIQNITRPLICKTQ